MKKKLTLHERILLTGLFPSEHEYKTIVAFEKLKANINFSEEEIRKFDMSVQVVPQVDGGNRVEYRYNKEVAEGYEAEIEIPALCVSYISGELKRMNEEKQISSDLISVYEKFVG